ncbi:4-carboxymuconolactone decarboxylase [Gaeumannomyces tritici R3-111a-1]|uniref:4-carboxymuconolactone decarboxylase n=1 Tax=Gaeumannomyces tritici (strain R3-111a-1) TaxID=644352 RepID=J3NGK3_GAET3|nr:4-carboxymuconolactone decarboxylase [Gaeumannomyces tritici R3-111a-1]EJT80393.1 4-carboxymuconolactone decarboxylase [Gaeumannomyces tritici R3-111a-1]
MPFPELLFRTSLAASKHHHHHPLTTRLLHITPAPNMRIPYVSDPPPASTPEDAAVVARVAARRAPRPLQPLDLALLHSPPVADGWNSFLGAVRTRSSLPADLRELAICRVAVVNTAWYEWMHHAPLAREGGVPEEAMRRQVRAEGPVPAVEKSPDGLLSDRQWAVLRYTDEMTRNVRVSDDTFTLLKSLFSDREVVEITATVACYNCVSRFLVALDVGEKNSLGPDEVDGSSH